MNLLIVWVLAGLCVLLIPGRRRAPARPGRDRQRSGTPAARRPRVLAGCALLGLAGAGIVTFGPVRGLAVAAVSGPVVLLGARLLERRAGTIALDRSLALTLDLVAAALRSGKPLADALVVAAPAASAAPGRELLRVAGLLRLGAEPDQAWAGARAGPLEPVAVVAVRSASSGMRLAAALERAAGEIRAECAATATARAHRAGVSAMAPLAACFLPSFVCLGVVPVIIGIARSALGVLP